MRLDLVTIFPAYFAPLELSLIGRAIGHGLLDVHVHDLRDWATDRHRSVDDAPYGGGAGMVMSPEPWGRALDAVTSSAPAGSPTIVVPTPAGEPFRQPLAVELAARDWLVFACGRYEGIDQRVVDEYAARFDVREVSVGDYVLNGGEAAALVIVEAVARLLPGVLGNPQSLAEESHGPSGPHLLEAPVYTRPPQWRGHEVPDVLLEGDHERVAEWRAEQSARRTALRRPDLAHPPVELDAGPDGPALSVEVAAPADAGELLTLQRACWADRPDSPVPAEDTTAVAAGIDAWTTLLVRAAGRLVAAGRCRPGADGAWEIGRLMVAPDLRGRSLGRMLLGRLEAAAPDGTPAYRLVLDDPPETRLFRRAGYRRRGSSLVKAGGPERA